MVRRLAGVNSDTVLLSTDRMHLEIVSYGDSTNAVKNGEIEFSGMEEVGVAAMEFLVVRNAQRGCSKRLATHLTSVNRAEARRRPKGMLGAEKVDIDCLEGEGIEGRGGECPESGGGKETAGRGKKHVGV